MDEIKLSKLTENTDMFYNNSKEKEINDIRELNDNIESFMVNTSMPFLEEHFTDTLTKTTDLKELLENQQHITTYNEKFRTTKKFILKCLEHYKFLGLELEHVNLIKNKYFAEEYKEDFSNIESNKNLSQNNFEEDTDNDDSDNDSDNDSYDDSDNDSIDDDKHLQKLFVDSDIEENENENENEKELAGEKSNDNNDIIVKDKYMETDHYNNNNEKNTDNNKDDNKDDNKNSNDKEKDNKYSFQDIVQKQQLKKDEKENLNTHTNIGINTPRNNLNEINSKSILDKTYKSNPMKKSVLLMNHSSRKTHDLLSSMSSNIPSELIEKEKQIILEKNNCDDKSIKAALQKKQMIDQLLKKSLGESNIISKQTFIVNFLKKHNIDLTVDDLNTRNEYNELIFSYDLINEWYDSINHIESQKKSLLDPGLFCVIAGLYSIQYIASWFKITELSDILSEIKLNDLPEELIRTKYSVDKHLKKYMPEDSPILDFSMFIVQIFIKKKMKNGGK